MFSYLPTLTLIVLFILTPAVGQESDDTTAVEEEGSGREMFTSVDISYSQDKGNTDFLSLYYGLDYTLIGDAGPLTDTEFLFSFNRSDDQFDGEPFTDDQYLTLKFDIWANQRFSPFLFFQKSFDNVIGLQDRVNYGLGGKVGLLKGFSISYAFLFEKEDYLFYDYTDSTGAGEFYYTDSTLIDTNYSRIMLQSPGHLATERPISSLLGLQWVECTCNHSYSKQNSKRAVFTALFFYFPKNKFIIFFLFLLIKDFFLCIVP